MVSINFKLNVSPVSVNNMYYNDRRLGYKPDVRKWVRTVQGKLASPDIQQQFQNIMEQYDANVHAFSVEAIVYFSNFFNKQGKISASVVDCTNFEKPLADLLFLSRYCLPGAINIGVDDRFIVDFHSAKRPTNSSETYIDITIKLVPIPRI